MSKVYGLACSCDCELPSNVRNKPMEVGVAIAMLADDACKNACVFSWPIGSLQYQTAADGLEMEEDFRHVWKTARLSRSQSCSHLATIRRGLR